MKRESQTLEQGFYQKYDPKKNEGVEIFGKTSGHDLEQ